MCSTNGGQNNEEQGADLYGCITLILSCKENFMEQAGTLLIDMFKSIATDIFFCNGDLYSKLTLLFVM